MEKGLLRKHTSSVIILLFPTLAGKNMFKVRKITLEQSSLNVVLTLFCWLWTGFGRLGTGFGASGLAIHFIYHLMTWYMNNGICIYGYIIPSLIGWGTSRRWAITFDASKRCLILKKENRELNKAVELTKTVK